MILLNFNITMGSNGQFIVGLIPGFVGYIMLYRELKHFPVPVDEFRRALPWTMVMIFVSSLSYCLDFAGISYAHPLISSFYGLISTLMFLVVVWFFIGGVRRLGGEDLKAGLLFTLWKIMAVCNVLAYTSLISFPGISIAVLLAVSAVHIVFLYQVYQIGKIYDSWEEGKNPAPLKEEEPSETKDEGQ